MSISLEHECRNKHKMIKMSTGIGNPTLLKEYDQIGILLIYIVMGKQFMNKMYNYGADIQNPPLF